MEKTEIWGGQNTFCLIFFLGGGRWSSTPTSRIPVDKGETNRQ